MLVVHNLIDTGVGAGEKYSWKSTPGIRESPVATSRALSFPTFLNTTGFLLKIYLFLPVYILKLVWLEKRSDSTRALVFSFHGYLLGFSVF